MIVNLFRIKYLNYRTQGSVKGSRTNDETISAGH